MIDVQLEKHNPVILSKTNNGKKLNAYLEFAVFVTSGYEKIWEVMMNLGLRRQKMPPNSSCK